MKKEVFVLLFMVLLIMFFYPPKSVKSTQQIDACGKYSLSSCPSPQCRLEAKSVAKGIGCQRTKQSQVCVTNLESGNENCFLNNQNVLSDAKSTSPAEFFYEGV